MYIQSTLINKKLPARNLYHSEQWSLKFQQGHCPFWSADRGEEELGWRVHHCPGGWSAPVPPIRHLYQKIQENSNTEHGMICPLNITPVLPFTSFSLGLRLSSISSLTSYVTSRCGLFSQRMFNAST